MVILSFSASLPFCHFQNTMFAVLLRRDSNTYYKYFFVFVYLISKYLNTILILNTSIILIRHPLWLLLNEYRHFYGLKINKNLKTTKTLLSVMQWNSSYLTQRHTLCVSWLLFNFICSEVLHIGTFHQWHIQIFFSPNWKELT